MSCAYLTGRLDWLQPSSARGLDGHLNRLTIGHVVLGFMGFRSALLDRPTCILRSRALFRNQFATVEQLQWRLDHHAIAANEFACGVEALIEDRTPRKAFAGFEFWGSPVPRSPRAALARNVDLDPGQSEQACRIFDSLHRQIEVSRQRAHQRIRDVLTADQRCRFANLNGAAPVTGDNGHDAEPLFECMLRLIGLHGGQQAEIAGCSALLRHDVRRLHNEARQRFCALLSAQQTGRLREIENGVSSAMAGDEPAGRTC